MAEVPPKLVGSRVKRREDPRLITGNATYVDDIQLVRMLHMAVVRSEHASARIVNVDTSKAAALPGVRLILTAADINVATLPGAPVSPEQKSPLHAVLQGDRVRFVGDPIVAVIADDRYIAKDAAELVEVEYAPLPAVTDLEQAVSEGSPLVHDDAPRNTAYAVPFGSGDVDAAFAAAAVVVKQKMYSQRLAGVSLETRAYCADYKPGQDHLTLWSSTQIPHLLKPNIAGLLGMPESQVRVIAPEVGGGFGVKADVYPEEVLVSVASRKLGRPVKWVETRSEHLTVTVQGRGQVGEYEVAADANGKVLGMKVRILADLGAYCQLFTSIVPTLSGLMLPGPYAIGAVQAEILGVFTNKTPTGAYRGAGRPEATYYVERMMDLVAAELNLDPVEVRRRNFIAPDAFPYSTAAGLVYDTGDYDAPTRRCLEILGYENLRREQAQAREQGRHLGIGVATWVEVCGFAPSAAMPGVGGWEYALVKVERTGKVLVYTGASPHGQGQETSFAQIVADQFGIDINDVRVIHGDTDMVSHGLGTFGSRATVVGGAAVLKASNEVRDKVRKLAAHMLDASEDDIVLENGSVHVAGSPDRGKAWAEVVNLAYAAVGLPPDTDPGLEAKCYFEPPNFTFPFGTHAALVEVDPDTGDVKILRYVAVDDCGTIINPLLVEGQVHGGVVQGIAQALTENMVHDENGQPLSGTLMDYAVPTAEMFPRFETANTVTTTPVNPLGAKGIGEAGTIAASPTIVSAVCDALRPFNVRHLDMPLTSEKVWQAINA